MMAYTAFKAGDKVSWDGRKATVMFDSPEDNSQIAVSSDGGSQWFWDKEYDGIPVILES